MENKLVKELRDISYEIDGIAADLAAGDIDPAKAAENLANVAMGLRIGLNALTRSVPDLNNA
jgi:hypothetical protein